MKETLIDLKNRRSCRSFLPKQVEEELLNEVLEAGIYAPNAMGRQTPVIVAVQKKETVEALSKLNAKIMGKPGCDPFYGAPTVLVVLANSSVGSTFREDGCAVLTNLVNAAHAVGLGSCWVHRAKEEFESEEGKALLKKWGLSDKYVGIGHCVIGYAKEEPEKAEARKPNRIIRC